MGLRTSLRWLTAGGVLLHLSSTTSTALLKFNEGRDQLFATVSLSMGYDSNIFADATGEGDVFTNSSLAIEYLRHAGLIGVNGTLSWNLGSFASNTSENFANPAFDLELVKQTGRTTGSFTLGATRQSQADPVINQRTDSWNYNAGLNWKYPVITRYSFAGSLSYGLLDYVDESSGLVDLTTYGASTDLYYAYTSQRDLVGGYRIRLSDTSSGGQTTDHAVTAGVSGKILAKLKGVVRGGYQIRKDDSTGETHGSITASASTTWAVNKRFSITGTLNKDFSTTATESSVDNLSFHLDAQYAIRNRWSLYSGVGVGESEFLSGVDKGREDYYFTWSAGVNYTLNDHFKASLTYSYFQNWSNRSTSSYDRHSVTLNLTSRW
jgi:hypothetical protein